MDDIRYILGEGTESLRGRRILITGATGLIGLYMIDFLIWLNQQYDMDLKIYAAAQSLEKLNKRFGNQKQNLIFLECDLSLPETFTTQEQFDFIIHGASPTDPAIFATNPIGVINTNIIGTMQILGNAIKSNARFLFISSGEVYGHNTGKSFTESDPAIISTQTSRLCYPAAKIACEAACISAAQMHNLDINIVRPCFIYGHTISDTSSRVNAQFQRQVISGQNILLKSAGNQVRSWCYVADTVSAILYVLCNGISGETYNIANPESVASIYEYASILANIAGVEVNFAPGATHNRAKKSDSILNADKLLALGWRPVFDLKTGLQHSFALKSLACVYNE